MQIQDTVRNLNENVAFEIVMYALFLKFVRNIRVAGRNGFSFPDEKKVGEKKELSQPGRVEKGVLCPFNRNNAGLVLTPYEQHCL